MNKIITNLGFLLNPQNIIETFEQYSVVIWKNM